MSIDCKRFDLAAAQLLLKRALLSGALLGLSACVSSAPPTSMQMNPQPADIKENPDRQAQSNDPGSDKQLLLANDQGDVVSIPQVSPVKSTVISYSAETPATRLNPTIKETPPQQKQLAQRQDISGNEASAYRQKSNPGNQRLPVSSTSSKNKPGLLALLFQRPAKKPDVRVVDNQITDPVEEQSNNPVEAAGVPQIRPVQAGEIATMDNSSGKIIDNATITSNVETPANTPDKKPVVAKRPGFFALLKQRSRKNAEARKKPTDDRQNSILLSSRTASRANRETMPPLTSALANLSGMKNNKSDENVKLASVTGMARLSVNGILTQHSGVNVDCISPGIIRILGVVEARYGKKPVVSSGYRSPSRNRRAGGARNSMHVYCRAVDIQVEGVSKWNLAKFLRTVPGRGGIGTYCRTKSVHVDTGPKRDWHHSCRRKTRRKRKT